MKKIILILTLVAFGTIYVSCESNTYGEIATVTNPTYTKNIGPLFNSQCTGCHHDDLQYPNLTNFAEVKDGVQNGNVICLIDNPTVCFYGASSYMPPTGKMAQTTIDMVKKWLADGCPN